MDVSLGLRILGDPDPDDNRLNRGPDLDRWES